MWVNERVLKKLICTTVLLSMFESFAIAQPPVSENSGKQDAKTQFIASINAEIAIEPRRRMRGDDFEWDHEIQVALPPSYYKNPEKSYPVLWITDGSFLFDLAVRLVSSEIKTYVPEMIVVGVGTPLNEVENMGWRRSYEFSPSERTVYFNGAGGELFVSKIDGIREKLKAEGKRAWKEGRGAPKFLDFLVERIRPELSQQYRMSDEHILFGHSSGGLFCTYTLLANPKAFSKYICSSPNLFAGNHELFRMEERYAELHDDLEAQVFFGAGEAEMFEENDIIPAWGIVSSMARMVEILRLREYPSLKLRTHIFQAEDHMSVIPMNLSWGLRTLWQEQSAVPVHH